MSSPTQSQQTGPEFLGALKRLAADLRARGLDRSEAVTVAERFVFRLHPEAGSDKQNAGDFWAAVADNDRAPSADFVRGFAEGALAVGQERKGK